MNTGDPLPAAQRPLRSWPAAPGAGGQLASRSDVINADPRPYLEVV